MLLVKKISRPILVTKISPSKVRSLTMSCQTFEFFSTLVKNWNTILRWESEWKQLLLSRHYLIDNSNNFRPNQLQILSFNLLWLLEQLALQIYITFKLLQTNHFQNFTKIIVLTIDIPATAKFMHIMLSCICNASCSFGQSLVIF